MKTVKVTLIVEDDIQGGALIGALNHGLKDWSIGRTSDCVNHRLESISDMPDTYLVRKREVNARAEIKSETK